MGDVHECELCGGDGGDHSLAATPEGYVCLDCTLDLSATSKSLSLRFP